MLLAIDPREEGDHVLPYTLGANNGMLPDATIRYLEDRISDLEKALNQ